MNPALHGRTVLIVDDDELLRERLARSFARRGFPARHAASVDEARSLIADQPPDRLVFRAGELVARTTTETWVAG